MMEYTSKETLFKRGFSFMLAVSVGSLGTSCGFYFAYDQWHPMVWSASVVAVLHLGNAFVKIMDNA